MKQTLAKIRGFTLIELLVVIAIIALMTGIIVTNLSSSRGKARDTKRISDVGQLQLTLELFYDRCRQYPSSLVTTDNAGGTCPSGITLGSYISQIPTSPTGTAYDYVTNTTKTDYVLHTTLVPTILPHAETSPRTADSLPFPDVRPWPPPAAHDSNSPVSDRRTL